MKKRVGILNGTPIVEGDPNLLSNKERRRQFSKKKYRW